jgi:hypothetical protein
MAAFSIAHKEHRKGPFLKAFARTGKIGAAARASRISRDAVHDWRRNDPTFASAFIAAKSAYRSLESQQLQQCADFILASIRPSIPVEFWPRVSSVVALAVANRRFNTDFESTVPESGAPSRTATESKSVAQASPGLGYPEGNASGLRRPF